MSFLRSKIVLLCCIAAHVACPSGTTFGQDTIYGSQQLIVNPFMTGEDYTGWEPDFPWRNDGAADRQVFDLTTDGPLGFFGNSPVTLDVSTSGDHLLDPNYDSATARLTGLTFDGVFIESFTIENAGPNLEVLFFIELDIDTTNGQYRIKSTELSAAWTLIGPVLDSNDDYVWQDGDDFLGDPFKNGGIVLDEIISINAKYFMWVVVNNASGSGPVFTTMDNTSIRYEISVPSDFLLGDINQDGAVDLLDVSPFVGLISSSEFQLEADINMDGAVTLLDVGPFVDLLTGS